MAGADMPLTATTDTLGVLMLIVSLPASSDTTPPRQPTFSCSDHLLRAHRDWASCSESSHVRSLI